MRIKCLVAFSVSINTARQRMNEIEQWTKKRKQLSVFDTNQINPLVALSASLLINPIMRLSTSCAVTCSNGSSTV